MQHSLEYGRFVVDEIHARGSEAMVALIVAFLKDWNTLKELCMKTKNLLRGTDPDGDNV